MSVETNIVWWVLFFHVILQQLITTSLDVAIVSMTDYSQETKFLNEPNSEATCVNPTYTSQRFSIGQVYSQLKTTKTTADYNWSTSEVNVVLSSYYWLSAFASLCGGYLPHKLGSKVVGGYAQLMASLLSILIPISAAYGPVALSCLRAAQGFFANIYVPGCFATIMGDWCVPQQRGKFGASIQVGIVMGNGLGNLLFGFIAEYANWRYIFYLTTIYGAVCCVAWYLCIYDTPLQHPTISEADQNRIMKAIGVDKDEERPPIPWMKLFCDVSVLVCLFGGLTKVWMETMFTTYLPTYLRSTYNLRADKIGTITSFPQFVAAFTALVAGLSSDFLVKSKRFRLITVRKLCVFIAYYLGPMSVLILVLFTCNLNVFLVCILLSGALRAVGAFGPFTILVDSNPKFCGPLHSVAGLLGSITTIFFTTFISYLSSRIPTVSLWNTTFVFSAILMMIAGTLCILYASSDIRPWNRTHYKEIKATTDS